MKRLVILTLFVLLLCGIGIFVHMGAKNKLSGPQDAQSYLIKGGKVYYRTVMQVNEGPEVTNDFEMKDADAKTFVTLDPYWAKDHDSIFYTGQTVRPMNGTSPADIASFALIQGSSGLAKDNRAVYLVSPRESGWFYAAVPEADPATFVPLDRFPYATDKKNAYYLALPDEVKKIEGVDGASFEVLGECAAVEVSRAYYARDARSVIAGDKVLEGVDRETFKIVAGFDNGNDGMRMAGTYSVDKNRVYKNCGEVVPSGNPATCSATNIKECE